MSGTPNWAITDPSVSECGRFFVNPVDYYGEAYCKWRERRPTEAAFYKLDLDLF